LKRIFETNKWVQKGVQKKKEEEVRKQQESNKQTNKQTDVLLFWRWRCLCELLLSKVLFFNFICLFVCFFLAAELC